MRECRVSEQEIGMTYDNVALVCDGSNRVVEHDLSVTGL